MKIFLVAPISVLVCEMASHAQTIFMLSTKIISIGNALHRITVEIFHIISYDQIHTNVAIDCQPSILSCDSRELCT